MILHIPHSSFIIPPEVRVGINLGEEELKQELALMTDAFTDELFDLDEPHYKIVYPVSRLVCDPERFLGDEAEPMSEVGMAAVYTCTSDGRVLRSVFESSDLIAEIEVGGNGILAIPDRAFRTPAVCLYRVPEDPDSSEVSLGCVPTPLPPFSIEPLD